ncbi:MAG: flavodoxin family protein [Planctomycetes bacterium]|nr:flavodoxin family protein [Planctomycetota bacterium]
MARVLILSGSPREGGNTDDCVARVSQRLGEGGHEVETIRVCDLDLKPCMGCRRCMELGRCAITDDDFNAVWQKTPRNSLLISAAPVYWFAPPGPMKNFIDRTHAWYARTKPLDGLLACLLSVAADDGCWEPHEAVMKSWLVSYGAQLLAPLRVQAREKGEALSNPDTLKRLDRWAQQITTEL